MIIRLTLPDTLNYTTPRGTIPCGNAIYFSQTAEFRLVGTHIDPQEASGTTVSA
jgi:hypothetical protein